MTHKMQVQPEIDRRRGDVGGHQKADTGNPHSGADNVPRPVSLAAYLELPPRLRSSHNMRRNQGDIPFVLFPKHHSHKIKSIRVDFFVLNPFIESKPELSNISYKKL
jgi:hypothetical protein